VRDLLLSTHKSSWEHSSHFRLLEGASPVCLMFPASVQFSLFGLPQGKSSGPHMKDQESNPQPHTPRLPSQCCRLSAFGPET